jgi:hypothetical protein
MGEKLTERELVIAYYIGCDAESFMYHCKPTGSIGRSLSVTVSQLRIIVD